MINNDLRIFTGNANPELAQKICSHLKVPLGQAVVSTFSDGEIRVEIGENVRGRDVFLIQSTCPPANHHLMELLIMIDSCKRDSGTVQEECAIFKVANVTLRDVTERPETIECGSNILTGADPESIIRCVQLVLERRNGWSVPREYLAENVSDTVIKILLGYGSEQFFARFDYHSHMQRRRISGGINPERNATGISEY